MSDPKERTQVIINRAEKAIAKITDPAVRAKAVARLEATKKRMAQSRSPGTRSQHQHNRARDRDIER